MAALSKRCCLAALLAVCAGLPAVAAPSPAAIPILVYHRFNPLNAAAMTVRTSTFEQQLDWLDAHHYSVVPLSAAIASLNGSGPAITSPAVVITADDGHESVYTQMYPIIRQRHLHVTLFIYPSAISHASYALTWDQLAEMMGSGLVDVQSHTYWHPNFNHERAQRTPADYAAFVDMQLQKSKQVLDHKLSITVTSLAWPYGIVNPQLEAAATRAGYQQAFAFAGGPARVGDDPLAIPRIPVPDYARGRGFANLIDAQP